MLSDCDLLDMDSDAGKHFVQSNLYSLLMLAESPLTQRSAAINLKIINKRKRIVIIGSVILQYSVVFIWAEHIIKRQDNWISNFFLYDPGLSSFSLTQEL